MLEALRGDSMARLRHAVLREAGIPPFSLKARLIGRRALLRYACNLVLDAESAPTQAGDSFDMQRFMEMKEADHGGI